LSWGIGVQLTNDGKGAASGTGASVAPAMISSFKLYSVRLFVPPFACMR
jgi:hypothetical protein